jgi:hypothetical protein
MKYVGIRCTFNDFDLQRELLLFDTLALPFLESLVNQWADGSAGEYHRKLATELEWLATKGVVVVPSAQPSPTGPAADDYREWLRKQEELNIEVDRLKGHVPPRGDLDASGIIQAYIDQTGDAGFLQRLEDISRESYDHLSRVLAVGLSEQQNTIALPIMSTSHNTEIGRGVSRTDVLNITVGSLPIPSSGTPLEQLLDFRSDPAVRADFLALHRWASTTALENKRPSEIREEVEYLVAQYQRHMQVHKLETGVGAVETIVTVTAEALEDLVKLKWGKAAKLLFSFRKRRIALLKAELNAPGRELAYLVKASKSLGRIP